jgi:hypothetical protein
MARGQCASAGDRGTLVGHWMGDQKFTIRASEATLSLWFRLHLQSLAPTNPH